MRCGRVEEHAADNADLGRLLREVDVVDVLGAVEVDAQDAPVGEGEDEDIVGDLGGHKVGSDGELELDALDVEDGQSAVCEVRCVGGPESVGCIERHPGVVCPAQSACIFGDLR
jgi:hypothetical protein